MAQLLVLHGPNLNLLGQREPELYGNTTLAAIDSRLQELAKQHGHSVNCLQSNAEHQLIEQIHDARDAGVGFIIINAAGLTHTSVALRDALSASAIPFIEVHISNIYARESFRQHSYLSAIAAGVICGLGVYGYELALLAANQQLQHTP